VLNQIKLVPSTCRRFHITVDGLPAYAERFDDVLKFHPPGLAAVQANGHAWHIRPDGSAAYPQRFNRTFGFYDGLAAVSSGDGWFHIRPEGSQAYSERYAWCGNFQNQRSTVRDTDGSYFHIDSEGSPLYAQVWRYAGDFRDGVAVVQDDAGYSTHIDSAGIQLHGRWFLDLDVFHKGFARARDEDGWTHVDEDGKAIYQRRFAAVEPFYNGQARVERLDGGLEVIDESGATLVALRPALRSDFAELSSDMVGFWRTQTLAAAASLKIMDALPGTADSVARASGISTNGAHRLLRALGELNVTECTDQIWKSTAKGQYLQSSHPMTLADAATEYGGRFSKMWTALPAALKQEGWVPPRIFEQVTQDPDGGMGHHRMLRSYGMHDYDKLARIMPVNGAASLVDVGGGLGTFAGLIASNFPGLTITVLDLPAVVEIAQRQSEYAPVLQWKSGDFFSDWDLKADGVVLARVLHDWNDEDALRILKHARKSLNTGGKVFVVEMLMPDHGVSGALCDLHLLLATGGRERTLSEFQHLLQQAEFVFDKVIHTSALPAIIIGSLT